MQKKVTITFYDIEKCGLYKRGYESKVASGISELLNDSWEWTMHDNKPLTETCPYEPPQSGNYLRTFLIGLECSSSETYLLSSWNETPSEEGSVASLDGASTAYDVELNMTKMAPNAIPGYPTYFWFLPSHRVYATIQVDHGLNGNTGMNAFLRGAVKQCIGQVRWDRLDDGDLNWLGYTLDGENIENGLSGVFKSSLRRRSAQKEYLRKNIHKVRKIHRKHELTYSIPDDRGLFEKLMMNIGRQEARPFEGKKKIVFELETSVSRDEFDLLVDNFEQDKDAAFEDVGFTLTGESSPIWLSHSLARQSFEIDITKEPGKLVDGLELLRQLEKRKREIMAILG